ncbi:hypothetical protein KF840_12325 [bacterium]|nr:hypothetical protein [bacterium]
MKHRSLALIAARPIPHGLLPPHTPPLQVCTLLQKLLSPCAVAHVGVARQSLPTLSHTFRHVAHLLAAARHTAVLFASAGHVLFAPSHTSVASHTSLIA